MMSDQGIFKTKIINLADTTEEVVLGGRDQFHLLSEAFEGIKQIGVIGWGSQAPSQAQNLRDSLEGTGIVVKIGLRKDSPSFMSAATVGFTVENGTAGEMYDVIEESDLVLLLVADGGQTKIYQRVQMAMKSGATLGFSHGFLLGHMQNNRGFFRKDINVVGVCPKGMGPSVRCLYVQGKNVGGAGINSSYAVHQDYTGTARNIALAWAVAIGSPYVFETTLDMERKSDLFGERAVLLGGIWGAVEALYTHYREGMGEKEAFYSSAMSLTGPTSMMISERGLVGIMDLLEFTGSDEEFFIVLGATYKAVTPLLAEIYAEVASGREVASVVEATVRLEEFPMARVDGSRMWRVGKDARESNEHAPVINAVTAGTYLGILMAQVDILREKGHCWSEVCNETVIEAVDSLNPYIDARGIAYMVDNCSTTARLGCRRWGPNFMQIIGSVLSTLENREDDEGCRRWFMGHPIHSALAECMKMRPPVNISVV